MNIFDRGEPVEFEFLSADATTAGALVIRTAGGAARTLASDERLVIDTIDAHIAETASPADNVIAWIIRDTDEDGDLDAGDLLAVLQGGGNHSSFWPTGMAGAKGVIPKVLADAAAQITIAGNGYVMKG